MKKIHLEYRKKDTWFNIFIILIVILYLFWWSVSIYLPYREKRGGLSKEVISFDKDIKQRDFQESEDSIKDSFSRINALSHQLPVFDNITVFIDRLNAKADEYSVSIKEIVPVSYSSLSYPSITKIDRRNLTIKLMGDFFSIGKFTQSLEEEFGFFCYITNIFIEKSFEDNPLLSARIKLDIFFKKG